MLEGSLHCISLIPYPKPRLIFCVWDTNFTTCTATSFSPLSLLHQPRPLCFILLSTWKVCEGLATWLKDPHASYLGGGSEDLTIMECAVLRPEWNAQYRCKPEEPAWSEYGAGASDSTNALTVPVRFTSDLYIQRHQHKRPAASLNARKTASLEPRITVNERSLECISELNKCSAWVVMLFSPWGSC